MLEQSLCQSGVSSAGLLLDVPSFCGDMGGSGGSSSAFGSSVLPGVGGGPGGSGVDAASKNMNDLDDLNRALYDMGAQDLLLDVWDGMDVEVG